MSIVLASVTSENATRIVLALGMLGVALVVLAGAVWYYRRWVRAPESGTSAWTLEDFRAMRDRGEVTEAEYQRLRGLVLGQVQGDRLASEPASVKPVGSGKKASANIRPAGFAEPGLDEGGGHDGKIDASGDTVWSFDLKKTPPG